MFIKVNFKRWIFLYYYFHLMHVFFSMCSSIQISDVSTFTLHRAFYVCMCTNVLHTTLLPYNDISLLMNTYHQLETYMSAHRIGTSHTSHTNGHLLSVYMYNVYACTSHTNRHLISISTYYMYVRTLHSSGHLISVCTHNVYVHSSHIRRRINLRVQCVRVHATH